MPRREAPRGEMSKSEQLQAIWRRYEVEHGYEPTGTRPVVDWAVESGLLELPPVDPRDVLASQMSRALREETAVDAHGREHRVNHALKVTRNGVQQTMWGIFGYAPAEHMEGSFTLRREQIVSDSLHLRIDVDAFNDLDPTREPYQLELDFTQDVEERLAIAAL
jgi:hypothetical protein